eukprot:350800-Alexandrium_andersonii.AAC.1
MPPSGRSLEMRAKRALEDVGANVEVGLGGPVIGPSPEGRPQCGRCRPARPGHLPRPGGAPRE